MAWKGTKRRRISSSDGRINVKRNFQREKGGFYDKR